MVKELQELADSKPCQQLKTLTVVLRNDRIFKNKGALLTGIVPTARESRFCQRHKNSALLSARFYCAYSVRLIFQQRQACLPFQAGLGYYGLLLFTLSFILCPLYFLPMPTTLTALGSARTSSRLYIFFAS